MLRTNLELDIRKCISEDKYYKNKIIIDEIKSDILKHKAFFNPVLQLDIELNNVSLGIIHNIHMDYRHAIVQIFTDALLAAALSSNELESTYKLPAGTKMIPRALLTPNFLDEFGLRIESNQLIGAASYAHYSLFENVLKTMQVIDSNNHISCISKRLREYLESFYHNHSYILLLLAVAELQVIYFTPCLEKLYKVYYKCQKFDYYHVHGIKESDKVHACDDEHAEDLWLCLTLLIDQVKVSDLIDIANSYLDLWNDFWLYQLDKVHRDHQKDEKICGL